MNRATDSSGPSPASPLPAALLRMGAWLSPVLGRLPVEPPSWLLARMLSERWWPQVAPQTRAALCGRRVDVVVRDLGLRFRLCAEAQGIRLAAAHGPVCVTIQADARAFLDLMAGQEDPDTLFFERRLVMEGDTAFALLLKNTIDAVGPVAWFNRDVRRPAGAGTSAADATPRRP